MLLSVLLLAACSSSGSDVAAPSTAASSTVASTVESSTTAATREIPPVVNLYVEALDSGDIAAANAMRCEKGRVPDSVIDRFRTEVDLLRTAAGGHLTTGTLKLIDPVTLGSLYGTRPDAQVAFSLLDPAGESSLVAVAVITEGGQQRLCGSMQEGSPGVQADIAASTIVWNEGPVGSLATALPAELLPGSTQVDDAPVGDLSQIPGALDSWSRAWSTPDAGGLRVTLFRMGSSDAALTLAKQILQTPGLDTAEQITGLPKGYQGVSVATSAWTWVQPASLGLRTDRAAGVVGDVAVVVELTGEHAGTDHATLAEVVQAIELS